MIEVYGDLWEFPANARCVTTNAVLTRTGEAVMGAGVARSAKERFPDLPRLLGKKLKEGGNHVHYLGYWDGVHLYSFPTKRHWKDPSDPELIRRSCRELRELVPPDTSVVMTRPGCGNGGLDWAGVRPIVASELDEDRFHVIEPRWRVVRLSETDVAEAEEVGRARQVMHDAADHYDAKVLEDGRDAHIQGAIGEKVVSAGLGLPWDGKFFEDADWQRWRRAGHDVSGLEVKATKHRTGRLFALVRENELRVRDDAIYVLVRLLPSYCVIAGWAWGREIREFGVTENYGAPCRYLPEEHLRAVEELEGLIERFRRAE